MATEVKKIEIQVDEESGGAAEAYIVGEEYFLCGASTLGTLAKAMAEGVRRGFRLRGHVQIAGYSDNATSQGCYIKGCINGRVVHIATLVKGEEGVEVASLQLKDEDRVLGKAPFTK